MNGIIRMPSDDPWPSRSSWEFGDEGVFRSFFDRSGLRAARLDGKLCVVEASVDFATGFGRPAGDLRGGFLPGLLHTSVRAQVTQQLERLIEGRRNRFAERVVALHPDGGVFGAELTGLAVHGEAGLVDGVMVLMRPEPAGPAPVVADGRPLLSDMDARILEGVAAGASTIQLAATLHLSCGGVEYHLTALLRSMQVRNRSALVSKTYATGIFCVGSWPPRVLPEFVAAGRL